MTAVAASLALLGQEGHLGGVHPQLRAATRSTGGAAHGKAVLEATLPPRVVVPGKVLRRKPQPRGTALVTASLGRVGTGLTVGPLSQIEAPVGGPVQGAVTTAVANLPNRTSDGGFALSMRALTAAAPDFVMLNEISRHSEDDIRAAAPGYDVYRDPSTDPGLGGVQSLNNAVLWRADRWTLADAGRVKLVDNDIGYYEGHPFTWDRYAIWAVLQRGDGSIVSVVSVHMMTNPGKYPRQPRRAPETRIQRYSAGMDVLRATVDMLETRGPVLVGGDMNSHPDQGAWTAAAKLTADGFQYAKDSGVMYLFYPDHALLEGSRQMHVVSDHPALVATVDLNGQGPS